MSISIFLFMSSTKSASACQDFVENLMSAIENPHSGPNNPRRVVELWSKMGEECAAFTESPYGIYERQNQYRVFLGDVLYEKISNRTAVRVPLTFLESIKVSDSVSRHQMDDVQVLCALLSSERRSEFECDFVDRSFR